MAALDWQQVTQRPDWSLTEKRRNWAEHCARRGIKPDPKAYPDKEPTA